MPTQTQRSKTTDNGKLRTSPDKATGSDANLLGGLTFTIVAAPVSQPKRGGGLKPAKPVPDNFRAAYNTLLNADKPSKVGPMIMTNGQINSLLGANPSSAVSKLNKANPRGAYVQVTVTTLKNDEYPNIRSNDADHAADEVRVEWSLRYRTDEEQAAHLVKVAERTAKRLAKAAAK